MRVGLLEDDIAIQEMLLLVLEDEGHSVINFPSADVCLQTFERALQADSTETPPALVDVMIIDWRLNGPMTGTEVIRRLRTHERLQSLPIILTTAATFNDTAELQDLRITLLEKPFSVDEIASLIQQLT